MVIAQDLQGAEVAKPWVEKAGGTYRALLDQHNAVGKAYNLKYVPVGIIVDEEGRLAKAVSNVNIDDDDFAGQLAEWVETGAIPQEWIHNDRQDEPRQLSADEAEADARFQLAQVLLQKGEKDEAIAELKRAVQLDPQNWLIRKQLWAIEVPEAFYEGNVDYAWQKAQMEREEQELLGGQ